MNRKQIGVGGLIISEEEKRMVMDVLDSGQLTYGPVGKKFEEEFSKSHGCRFGLFMNSGTSALHVALQAMKDRYGWADGDEVIVPSVTFVATANIVLHNRMKPVFVDVEPDTFCLNPNLIEEKITERTRCIIPVHLLGLPASMDGILNLAATYRLKIIEDTCETMFAEYKGRKVGSLGDVGCFSTYVAHFLVTGVGGLAITNNPELADDMRSLMNHGRDTTYISSLDDANVTDEELQNIIDKRFSFIHVGHSFRCTEMEAAIGLGQLARSQDIIEKRQRIARQLTEGLRPLEEHIQLPHIPEDRSHSFMLYGLVVKNEKKNNLVYHLEKHGIETRDLLPLVNQPVYKRMYGNIEANYPVAERLNRNAFYIGCHPYMDDEDVSFTIECFHKYFKAKS